MEKKNKGFWSVGRLIIGIMLIVLAMYVLFQSCAVGVFNSLDNNEDMGDTAGLIVATIMIAAGITGTCTRNSTHKAGPIVTAVLLLIGALLAFCNAAVFKDLTVWGVVCIAFAIVFVICAIKTKKEEEKA